MASDEQAIVIADKEVGMQALENDLLALNAQIDVAIKLAADAESTDEQIAAMDYKDIKNVEQALSKSFKDAEEVRKKLKRDWNEPLKLAEAKYNEAMQPVKDLHERFKAARTKADEREAEEKRSKLEAAYVDFVDASGLSSLVDLLPFERICESKWTNKSCSLKKAETELTQKVAAIIADWESLKKTQYHYPEEAQAEFFRTLSLRDVNENDAHKWEEAQRIQELSTEVGVNQEFQYFDQPSSEPLPEILYCDQPIIQEAESIVANAEEQHTYIIEAVMTESQWVEVRAFFQAHDIHGKLKQVVSNG